MAAVGAFGAQALFAKHQVQVVADDQAVFHRYFFFLHPVTNSLAAEVHVGVGFQQNQRPPFKFHFRQLAVVVITPRAFQLLA